VKKVRGTRFLSIGQNKKHLPSDFRRSIDALHRISFVFILPRFSYMVAALYKQLRAVFLPPQFYFSPCCITFVAFNLLYYK
jgi:hypothetical protein